MSSAGYAVCRSAFALFTGAPLSNGADTRRTVDGVRCGFSRPGADRVSGRGESDTGGWWNVTRKQSGGGGTEVFRITGARTGLQEDVRGRQRRYIISMSVRTVAVILAASLWNVERYVAIVALALGVLLPYVAVVIANAGRENVPSLPSTFVTMPSRPMITPPVTATTATGEAGPNGGTGRAEHVTGDAAAGPSDGPRTERTGPA
jgi:hypothetical protein